MIKGGKYFPFQTCAKDEIVEEGREYSFGDHILEVLLLEITSPIATNIQHALEY